MKPNFKIWNSQPIQTERNGNVYLGENTKGMAKFGKVINLDLTSQQKLGAIQDNGENSQPSKQKPRPTVQHSERTAQKVFQRPPGLPLPF